MEDRRTALAIFLCIIVAMVYSEVFLAPLDRAAQPPQSNIQDESPRPDPQTSETARVSDGLATSTNNETSSVRPEVQKESRTKAAEVYSEERLPTPAEIEKSSRTIIDTASFRLQVVHLGARAEEFLLRQHTKELHSPELYDVVMKKERSPLPLGVYVGEESDALVPYRLKEVRPALPAAGSTYQIPRGEKADFVFEGMLPSGKPIEKIFSIHGDGFLFDIHVQLGTPIADGSSAWLEWTKFVPDREKNNSYNLITYTYIDSKGDLETAATQEVEESADEMSLGPVKWVALGNKYFMAALLPSRKDENTRIGFEHDVFYERVRGDSGGGKFSLYVGPKERKRLEAAGHELHRAINLGIFAFLAEPLMAGVRFFHSLLGNWGLAIVLLTLAIKFLFLPLTQVSFRSMQKMQQIQPEMKALRERIKDPTQLNQEMMALYKKHNVNPMGGCLPILIQLPVFLGLYNGLLNSIELRHAEFALWIQDLSAPERLMVWGIPVPVMILLMGASMALTQWTTPTAADPTQKKVMMFMPVAFTIMFIIFPFPAGLVLYWLVNNVISVVQQMYLRSEKKVTPLQATIVSSIVLFAFSYVLTIL